MGALFQACVGLAVCLAFAAAAQEAINPDLVVVKVLKNVDLTTQLPKIVSQITLENAGQSGVRYFLVAADLPIASSLSFIGASIKSSSDEEKKLKVTKATIGAHQDKQLYRVDLPNSLESGKEVTVEVETIYIHTLRPYPSHITQAEKQFVKFVGNVYFYSPYKSRSQTTIVTCASSSIDFFTREKPSTQADKVITYGPYEDVDAFKQVEMVVHYENNAPFLTVTHMTRLIEVSHWGNIAVEESYDMVHSGAILKGPFSRYDYQRNQDGVSSIKSFKTMLPASARDVYYRDEIGNISTSHLHETEEGVELELRPRFPLFGGWKTNYYIGYNVPSYQYLFNKGDNYALAMKFIDHIFDDQVIDHLTVVIILPEGSKDIKLKTPYDVRRDADKLHFTYLDTVGRPVVTLHKNNLVEQHIQDFELHYVFPKYMLLQEPLLVVGAFYLLFVLVIIYVRLDFSISKDEASESRMRVASLIEQTQAAHDRRSALYQSYEDAINKFKSSKDMATFTANRKKIDSDYKQLTNDIGNLQAKLKGESSDASEKVAELQRLDSQVREQLMLSIQHADRLVAGRISKQQYLDLDGGVRAKRDELCAKMEGILGSL